ncbi:MAG: sulfatase [bacterium]|nr:sulfatase [bacterium]
MTRPASLLALVAMLMVPAMAEPPNIVLIVADDLGYGDIGAYGNTANRTPHLDRLAREGLRFTDFHSNGPMCTPTRAALLTGLYQNRFGRKFEGPLSGQDDYDDGLPLEAITIAEVLKRARYRTAMYGKWHLGYHPPFLPASQGFDDFRGLVSGDGDHHSHIDRSGRKDWWHNNRIEMESGYTADLLTRHSIDFIARNKNRPFFLYVPHLAIHFPWQGPDDEGYRVEGEDYWNLSKLGRLKSKNVRAKTREMVEAVDRGVGRIVAAIEDLGLADNTLVFFTSDNGGYLTYQGGFHNISNNGPLRGQKGEVYEGGHRVPAIAWWPGRIQPGVSEGTTMTFDLFPTFLELAGIDPGEASGKLDGVSLARLLSGREPIEARTLFWRRDNAAAVRRGPWKLIRLGDQKPQLYNLADDIGETKNRAAARPALVDTLLRALAEWEADVDREK